MDMKTCKGCGWVYPIVTPYVSCRFCGRLFSENNCRRCNEFSDDIVLTTGLCRRCFNTNYVEYCNNNRERLRERTAKYYKEDRRKIQERYNNWLTVLKSVQTHTLTEEEWHRACEHFNGCALCISESIDARSYFIPFKEGGSYNKCNVLPVCDKCATDMKIQPNPFLRFNLKNNSNYSRARYGADTSKLENAVKYLQHMIEEVHNE